MHTADRQNLSGTPSWALFDSHGVGDSALLGQPLLSQSPPGGGEIPGSAVWTRHFAARGIDEETRHLDQLRNRLIPYLEGVSPQGMTFVIDLVLSQAHEIWRLKGALEVLEGKPLHKLNRRLGDAEEAGTEWRNLAHTLAESNARLEDETHKWEMRALDSDLQNNQQNEYFEEIIAEAKYVKAETAEIKKREKGLEDRLAQAKLRDHLFEDSIEKLKVESDEIQFMRHDKANIESEVWSMKLKESSLRNECGELEQEVRLTREDLAKKVFYDKLSAQDVQKELRSKTASPSRRGQAYIDELSGTGAFSAATGWTQRLFDLAGPSDALRDPGSLFDAFASTGGALGAAPRLRPADFGHLCESLRRAEGRGPSPEEERKGFAEFAFAAVFGNQVLEVDKQRFIMLFDHFSQHLEELEMAYQHRSDTLARPTGSSPRL